MTGFMPLLEKKKTHVMTILQLTEKQARLISDMETEALLENIALRQKQLDRITELEVQLKELETQLGGYPEETRDIYYEILSLLEQISKKDKENEALAVAKREELKADMRKVAAAKRGNEAYERQSEGASVYFDKKE
ncbi:hypothetical protein LJC34_00575 [Oscillospiraceae bacterium OttesenSCG-928-G22]|nr:hypothetical protein [Oscillospiraceae bacterium OttesenSCG-928-G22]